MRLIKFLLLLLPVSAFAADASLDNVTVHLFLEKSGTLSNDITASKEFFTQNFHPYGEGMDENEIFHNFLIKIKFSSNGEIFIKNKVAQIKLVDDQEKIILEKSISSLYIDKEKVIYVGVWVSGHECNQMKLTVSSNEKTITKNLPFHCGE